MPVFLKEDNWVPIGVDELEPNADLVVRSSENKLVVAGPGAGKTELLAQRANFLLATGRCPAPKRILAISFKRDAAKNIENRVRERCAAYADRFDSFTLDSFAKRLVDRFLPALPIDWRPKARYQVRTASVSADEAELWLLQAPMPKGLPRPAIRSWARGEAKRVLDSVMHGSELPYDYPKLNKALQVWGIHWWREQLSKPEGTASLTFPMLNRLAAYLLRCNPKVVTALRLTYIWVFLDEFQDTTESQWDLVRSAFLGSRSVLTAVGDSKQRIMVWAGAKTDIFDKFHSEFSAERVDLVRNYRSAPELVRMQHVIAQALEAGSAKPVAAKTREAGVCQVLEFLNPEQEAAYLANLIHQEVESGEAEPCNYCVLVRQRVGDMITLLKGELGKRNLLLRDESALQDLRVEPLTGVVLPSLRLATKRREAQAWSDLVEELAMLSGLDPDLDQSAIERLAVNHKECVTELLAAGEGLKGLPLRLIQIIGENRYRSTYRQYTDGDYLRKVAADLGDALQDSLDAVSEARFVADDIAGVNVIPAMTIHKSKGLEFKTVIFLGLEDSQWWGFRYQPDEEQRAFFVAFSRAIERVLFTWSDVRDERFGRKRQQRENVDTLYTILVEAGVPVVDARHM
jgi:ATP-dependent DNA helicase UvrD/PcrA